MENFGELLHSMIDGAENATEGATFGAVLNDPMISFGPVDDPYTFATVLPERTTDNNVIDETALRFHSIIANASDRYSTPQFKSAVEGVAQGGKLADSNAGFKVEAPLVEQINKMLRRGQSVQATAAMVRAFEAGVVRPLTQIAELWRVQAVVNAQVIAVGMNGRAEAINYTNPSGARVVAAGQWSSNTYDPMPDIQAQDAWLRGRGYRPSRIIAGSDVVRILASNAKMIGRAVAIRIIDTSGVNGTTLTNTALPGRLSVAELNGVLANESLPPIEVDDQVYNTSTARGVYYYPRGTFTMLGVTAQREDIVDTRGNLLTTLNNTLGFTGIGTVVAQTAPGRVYENKYVPEIPPYATFKGYQTMLPIIEWEDAITVIRSIT